MTQRQGDAGARSTSRNPTSISSRTSRMRSTQVVSAALDDLGISAHAMAEHLRPVGSTVKFAGRERTIACVDTYQVDEDPYGMEIDAIDSILPGEAGVVSTGGSRRNAPWGELLSTAAIAPGARGAVVDGLVRDVRGIQDLGFPLFAAGMKPWTRRGADASRPTTCRSSAAACSSGPAMLSSPISTASSRSRRESSGCRPAGDREDLAREPEPRRPEEGRVPWFGLR